ncbi:MAG TPA: prolipoprotein diacylglyceryl transferase [Clostridia bacterium]
MIEFPGLGLSFKISPVALHFGSINLFWYGIIIALAFMLAVYLGTKSSERFGIQKENILDLVLFAAPVAIICARLYYVAFKWSDYSKSPIDIVKIWNGGLAIYGGVIGALIVAYLFARHKKIGVLKLIDFGVPYLVLAQGIGRWGNFVNQEAFGTNTTLPWGMTGDRIRNTIMNELVSKGVNPEVPVHPTFLYESLWNIAVFCVLIFYRNRKKSDGEVFCLYMALYGLGRSWIEGLRTDSLMLGNLRISQVLAILFTLVFISIFIVLRSRAKAREEGDAVTGTSEYGHFLKNPEENVNETVTEEVNVDSNMD